MGVRKLDEQIIVKIQPRKITVKKNRTPPMLLVNAQNFDPRIARIKGLEAPILQERGFRPTDDYMASWKGRYEGHPVQIYFPSEYPAVPFQWHWGQVPSGFEHVVGSKLCIEALLDNNAWTPELTVETVFEGLDSNSYFRKRIF